MAQGYLTPPSSPIAIKSRSICKAGSELGTDDEISKPDTSTPSTLSISYSPTDSSSTTLVESPAKQPAEFDAAELKRLLFPDTWRCGCITSQKESCRNWVRKDQRATVDSQLESIAGPIPTYKELSCKLKALARLVHCRYHVGEKTIERRVEDWIAVLHAVNQGTSVRKTLEVQIKEALGQLSTRCKGKSADNVDCYFEIGGQKVQNCAKTVQEIVNLANNPREDEKMEYMLQVLERNSFCSSHDKGPFNHALLWLSEIRKIRTQHEAEHAESTKEVDMELVDKSSQAPGSKKEENSLQEIEAEDHLRNPIGQAPSDVQPSSSFTPIDPAKYWPRAFDESPFCNISSYSSGKQQSSRAKVLTMASNELKVKAEGLNDGFVYLFQVKGNDRFVKIGYTSRGLDERHDEWQFECNRDPIRRYPFTLLPLPVPHARRIEALCHAQLDHCRVRIKCEACLEDHIEWFEVGVAEAIEIIQYWSTWMLSSPYQERTLRSETKWVLKPDEEKKLRDSNAF